MLRLHAFLLQLSLLIFAATTDAAASDGAATSAELCLDAAKRAERLVQMPDGMITGIMLAETGRWNKQLKRSYPWPWTITSGTDAWFESSRDAAVATVRRLQREGRTNIDVGCMQINLHWHPDAFASIEDALDPVRNVSYGTAFLSELFAEQGSWSRAVAAYHSRDPERGSAYLARVERLQEQQRFWTKDELQTAFAEVRAAWPLILRRASQDGTMDRAFQKGTVMLAAMDVSADGAHSSAPGSLIRLAGAATGGPIVLKRSFLFSSTPSAKMATAER